MKTAVATTNEDTYNGWKNRHTCDAYLWLSNTESSYRGIRALAEECPFGDSFQVLAEYEMEILGNPDDVDYSQVDWEEIHEAFSE